MTCGQSSATPVRIVPPVLLCLPCEYGDTRSRPRATRADSRSRHPSRAPRQEPQRQVPADAGAKRKPKPDGGPEQHHRRVQRRDGHAEAAPPTEAELLMEAVNALHPDEMSPREALEALYALKAKLPKH